MMIPTRLLSVRGACAWCSIVVFAAVAYSSAPAGAVIGAVSMPKAATARLVSSAAVRFNELGPENGAMLKRTGLWDMTETVWDSPGAAPVTTTGLVAERRMIGSMLQEVLRPAADVSGKATRRIDYLTFNRVEGRWEYVSMDMRAPVGIMTAQSLTRGTDRKIDIAFQPFAIAGPRSNVAGQMLRMYQVITRQGSDRDMKQQYFAVADGTGRMWLAHRYTYVRRR